MRRKCRNRWRHWLWNQKKITLRIGVAARRSGAFVYSWISSSQHHGHRRDSENGRRGNICLNPTAVFSFIHSGTGAWENVSGWPFCHCFHFLFSFHSENILVCFLFFPPPPPFLYDAYFFAETFHRKCQGRIAHAHFLRNFPFQRAARFFSVFYRVAFFCCCYFGVSVIRLLPLRSFFSWSFPYCFFIFSVSCWLSALPMNCAATWNLFFSSSLPLFLLSSHNSRECVTTAQNCSGSVTRNGVYVSIPPSHFFFFPAAQELLYNMDSFSASIWPIRFSLFRILSPRPCIN